MAITARKIEPTASEKAAPAPDTSELDRSLARGIAWTAGVRWIAQILSWSSTLIVARLLSPDDYGLVGMASVFLGLVQMVTDFGLGSAVITLNDITDEQRSQLNTCAVLFGFAAFGITALLAPAIAHFFATPQLTTVVIVLAAGFILAGFRTVPDAMLQKRLQFRTLALIEGSQTIVMAGVLISAAALGFGYWTLIMGNLLGALFTTTFAMALQPQSLVRPNPRSVSKALTFGGNILISQLSWYVYSNADFAVVGRMIGQRALGYYSMAWSLASMPTGKVSAVILRVSSAYFAAVQDNRDALKRYLLRLTEGVALVTFPLCASLAVLGHDIVLVVLGEKWLPAVLPLQLIAAYACIRSITPLLPQVLVVTKEERFAARIGIFAAIVLPIGFVVGSRYGLAGVAMAWIIVHPVVLLGVFTRTFAKSGTTVKEYALSLWPAVSGCIALIIAAKLVEELMPARVYGIVRLGAAGCAGVVAYGGVVLLFHRERVMQLRALLKK